MAVDKALSRLIEQDRGAARFRELVRIAATEYDTFEETAEDFKTRLSIGLSIGQQLDGIGEIVGLIRPITPVSDEDVFTFSSPEGLGKGFSGLNDPGAGGVFVGLDPFGDEIATDIEYRRLLRAKKRRNATEATIDEMYQFLDDIIGLPVEIVNGSGVVTLEFDITRALTANEQRLIDDLFPVAAGVRVDTEVIG